MLHLLMVLHKCERLTMNMPKKVCEDFAKFWVVEWESTISLAQNKDWKIMESAR